MKVIFGVMKRVGCLMLSEYFLVAPAPSPLERVATFAKACASAKASATRGRRLKGVRSLHGTCFLSRGGFLSFFEKSLCHFFCLPKKSNQKKGSEFPACVPTAGRDSRWFLLALSSWRIRVLALVVYRRS
jgi:hypothetical protein